MTPDVLLTNAETRRADALAAAAGVPGLDLMEAAGAAVAREAERRFRIGPVVVVCGPGNNGGDGFVAARLLKAKGWPVTVALLGNRRALKGDAAANAARWDDAVVPLAPNVLDGASLVIDALFGAGLTRPLDGTARAVVEAIGARKLACLAVDVPSGIHGDTGAILGAAVKAACTVTFFRRKAAHLVYPGRGHCGDVVVADIGIPVSVLNDIRPATFANGPRLWLDQFPVPRLDGHKYARGHAVIVGGAEMTGAARLAARGARRAGAGIVTIAAPPAQLAIYAVDSPGALVTTIADAPAFADVVADRRRNAILVGPGAGISQRTRALTRVALETGRACVLDADALTVFADNPQSLLSSIVGPCVLLPHEGEFARLFARVPGIDHVADKLTRARQAAVASRAVVLLKGADTVIAAPDGRAAINDNAPPWLATGGSGDVLAGFVVALLAQGMDAFAATAAATWLHGAAATAFGPGLIAEDLPEALPGVLLRLADISPEN
ncbi:MAG: NAD(P)H-hydrate dehydratase [Rhodospirillales bacterium]|nr:NAD(P)H-hydrate dehydratase [Rhodospirillales bacterium]